MQAICFETNNEIEDWVEYCRQFRVGKFEHAEDKIKKAWIYYCERFLPKINKTWEDKSLRANKIMSEVITVSDEAYLELILENKLEFWISQKLPGIKKKHEKKRINDEISVGPNVESESQQSSITADVSADTETEQKEGKEFLSPDELKATKIASEAEKKRSSIEEKKNQQRYFALFAIIKNKRAGDEGNSWENGYKDYISGKQDLRPPQRNQNDSVPDDEEEREEEEEEGREIEDWGV